MLHKREPLTGMTVEPEQRDRVGTGLLVSLEGIESCGKTTLIAALKDRLAREGIAAVYTREPGGTPVGDAVRGILLDPGHSIAPEAELLLLFASRAQHVYEVIQPALQIGKLVITDRFIEASYAYQVGGRGLPVHYVDQLTAMTAQGIEPDLTLLLDIPVDVSQARVRDRAAADRFELERADFFARVRETYLARARSNRRTSVIDATQLPSAVAASAVEQILKAWNARR